MSILKLKDSQGNWVGVPTIKGDTGNGISSAVFNNDYTLTLTFTDGTTYTTPSIRGEKGATGDTPTITASKTGKTTSIYVDGSEVAQIEDGTDGTDGIDGYSPSVTVTDITGGHRVVITDESGSKTFDVMDGATGATPNLTIGTVETLDPTDDATATITGTPENPVLNLGIPQGDTGEVSLADLNTALMDKADVITDTASGAVASFTDGADGLPLKSLVVDINPVQDLSQGDPSPENICPISGWTEVDVEQSGVNLFNKTQIVDGYINDANGELKQGFNHNKATGYISVVPNATYYIKSDQSKGAWGAWYDKDKNYISGITGYITTASDTQKTKIAPSNARYMRLTVEYYTNDTICYGNVDTFSVNYPSTDHDYHPYTGRSITIDLGQTVYGGKLDVLSGELVVDRAMVDLGTLNWGKNLTNTANVYRYVSNGISSNVKKPSTSGTQANIVCSTYEARTADKVYLKNVGVGIVRSGDISIYDPRFDKPENTAEEFKEAMDGVMLCYELATPITIQLTPQQVNSLLGVNNLWADSGDTEVEYRADTKLYIERLTAPDSSDMIADANITSGKYFMVGNSLYKATANIANGAQIIVGTNCIRKSLSEALNEINA